MSKITCKICGASIHSVQIHLRDEHPEVSVEQYKSEYPDAPLLSEKAQERIAARIADGGAIKTAMAGAVSSVVSISSSHITRKPMHEQFGLGKVAAAMNAKGDPIPISVFSRGREYDDIIPEIDKAYVFNIDLLKTVLLGLELNIPVYLWGHAGVGKSTVLEQVSAHTNRPFVRVQHTANTEESHIVGQTLANEAGTYWDPGILQLAMKHGWVYNADEYDYCHASVLSVYQAVLEGKPLVTKEAPHEWRVIHPHEDFRFVATGNTNGSGDETGLYLGTNMGNAANYSRFGITEQVQYMPKSQETAILVNQAGLVKEDAAKLVDFAIDVRKAFEKGDVSMTIGPRELINASKLGLRRGSWRTGLTLAYINRLNRVDRETIDGIAQRVFD